jgi:hypothetical protein
MDKKYFLIIGILFCIAFCATSQEYQYVPFPDSNSVWSEIYIKPWGEPAPRWDYNKYALFNEDTVINGMAYHKLFRTHASEITRENSECIGGIREDSLKNIWFFCIVYPYKPKPPLLYVQDEIKLYDFNVSIGDTIRDICFLLEYHYIVVKAIDTIQVYNSKRKVFSFWEPYWTYWIEGIGNVKGLIFPSGDLPTNGMDNDLICMHQNDTLMYYYSGEDGEYDDCVPQFVKDGVALLPNTEVKVYPNPAKGGLVNFEGLDFETLELYDLSGKLVREEGIHNEECYQLDVSNLPSGVYTYRLKTKGLVPTMGKIVVQ